MALSEHTVGLLYDALQAFEAPHRGQAYPVHKALRFDDLAVNDVYDWVVEQIDAAQVRSVLDAGCGVGYGAIRLSQKLRGRVTGISVSDREIASARAAAGQLGLAGRVTFHRATFDELPMAAYDLVVAVESLKHSADLAKSLRSVFDSLTPNGLLAIVEDFYEGEPDASAARRLAADWELARLYTESDYLAGLESGRCSVVDLSDRVRHAGALSGRVRHIGIELLRPFVSATTARALRVFRGGLRLEQLYADGAMTYKAIFCAKHAEESR